MNKLETIQHAKNYIDKMAMGINPLDNTPISESDLLNNVRISRCLFFVSEILKEALESNQLTPTKRSKKVKQEFSLTYDQCKNFPFSETPVPISTLRETINSLIDTESTKKLQHKSMKNWLLDNKILYTEIVNDKKHIYPTKLGESLGLSKDLRHGASGPYYVVLYNIAAQKFIIDNIESISTYPTIIKEENSKE